MDTNSRESSRSYLLPAGIMTSILIGVAGLILWGVTLVKVNSLGKRVENLSDRLASVDRKANSTAATADNTAVAADNTAATADKAVAMADKASATADKAVAMADKASADIVQLTRATQATFDSIGPEIGNLKASITKLEEAAKARAAALKAVGPGEYIVKPGDTGSKIAKAVGISITELEAVNPGIDWKGLRIGQTIKTK